MAKRNVWHPSHEPAQPPKVRKTRASVSNIAARNRAIREAGLNLPMMSAKGERCERRS